MTTCFHNAILVRPATTVWSAAAACALLLTFAGGCGNREETPQASVSAAPASPNAPADAKAAPAAQASEFVDKDFGFRATVPSGWVVVPAGQIQVPGRVLKAWSPGNGSTIVAFVQEGVVTAKQILDSSAAALRSSGCSILKEQVATVGGTPAMSLSLSGPGTGAALMPGGTVPTFQHWIAIPRQNRVLVLLATAPDATKGEVVKAFDGMVQSVKVE